MTEGLDSLLRDSRGRRLARPDHVRNAMLLAQGLRWCPACSAAVPLLGGWSRNRAASSGLSAQCAECDAGANLERQRRNPSSYARRHKAWRRANPERAAANARRGASARRARLRAAFIEQIDPFVVYERDGGVCQLCNEPVARDRFDIDHTQPLAEGGVHSYANVRLAHVRCNRQRGRGVALRRRAAA